MSKEKKLKQKGLLSAPKSNGILDTDIVNNGTKKDYIYLILLSILILFITIVRFRLLEVPLERDEGEYAYMGQLMLKGYAPYEMAYNMKYPGTALMYGLYMLVFGQTVVGVHLGLLVTNIISIILVFAIGKSFISKQAAVVSAAVFGLISISYHVLGFAFHATHLVTLFALCGTYVMLKAMEKDDIRMYAYSGVLFCLSFIMKQSGVFFLFFGFFACFYHLVFTKKYSVPHILKYLGSYSLGAITPFLLMLVFIYIGGSFDSFWFWTVTYLKTYATKVSWDTGSTYLQNSILTITTNTMTFWICSFLGVFALWISKSISKEYKILISLFLVFSILTTIPGFYFRYHYFIPILPIVGLLFGVFYHVISDVTIIPKYMGRIVAGVIFIVGVGHMIRSQSDYLFITSGKKISRAVYGLNPFIEAEKISKYIKENTSKEDKIAVLGSEPEIYFLSDRVSSTGYIYTYNLMETHSYSLKMQQEMVKEIETNPPKYIVYAYVPTTWLRQENSNNYLFNWAAGYLDQNYTQVGVVDMFSSKETMYKWDNEAIGYSPESSIFTKIYKRR